MSARVQQGRPGSAMSQSEMDDGQAEAELQKLQRQYRAMENERKAYAEESKVQLGKQRLTIEKLRRENQALQDELRVLDHKTDVSRTAEDQRTKADALLAQIALYQRNIKQAQGELSNADSELQTLFKQSGEVAAQNAAAAASQTVMSTPQAIDKHMRLLENRLDKALVKFNKAINANREMRTQIDMLRRERSVFGGVYRKFEGDLADHKKQMAEIVEFSNSAYEARDEAQQKMNSVRERAEKELLSHLGEMKELDRILEQDRRLKDFMSTKTGDRDQIELKRRQRLQNAGGNNLTSTDGLVDTLDQYEQVLSQLLQVTGAEDVNAVVAKFNELEDQNFSLFNYVNEVNVDIERAQEEVNTVQRDIDAIKQRAESAGDTRQQRLKILEEQLANAEAQATACEERRVRVTTALETLAPLVSQIFKKLSPDTPLPSSSVISAASGADTADPADLLVVLSSIEQETAELLVRNLAQSLPTSNEESNNNSDSNNVAVSEEGNKNDGNSGGANDSSANNNNNNESNANENGFENGTLQANSNNLNAGQNKSGSKQQQQKQQQDSISDSLLGQGPMAPVNLNVIVPGDEFDSDGASEDEDRILTRDELVQKTLRGIMKREKSGQVTQKAKSSRRRSPTRT